MSTFTIRKMEFEDLPQVFLLDCMSFTLPWTLTGYQKELRNAVARPWVIETVARQPIRYEAPRPVAVNPIEKLPGEKAIVGMLVLWLIIDEAHIATIAVHPDYRRQGIARKLLKHALGAAVREQAETAMLDVRASNMSAQNLYNQFGFEVAGRRKGYYKDNAEDALLMTATLQNWRFDEP